MGQYTTTQSKESVTLQKRANTKGGYSLYLEYRLGGVRIREALKMYLVPERTKVDRLQNQETLKTANAMKAKKIIEIQNGKAGLRKRKGEKVTLLGYMEERSTYYAKRGSRHYAQTVRNCAKYCEMFRGKDVRLSQVSKDYLLKFIEFLNSTDLGDGTIYTYFTCLLIVLNSAVREDLIAENPSKFITPSQKPKMKESTRAFLTLEEVKALMDSPCQDETTKKAFLFSCFTGLRVSDIRSLTWDKVIDMGDGRLQVQKEQQKTKRMVYIPLSPNAVRWLPAKTRSEYVFPDIPVSPTLDRIVDKWAKAAGIRKHVTFHVSRHTYATLLLTFGADIYTVSQLMGHKDVKTTQIYAKIIDENKRKTVELIPDIS